MALSDFPADFRKLEDALASIIKNKVDISGESKDSVFSYEASKNSYHHKNFSISLKGVQKHIDDLNRFLGEAPQENEHIAELIEQVSKLDEKDVEKLSRIIKKISGIASKLNFPEEKTFVKVPKVIPSDIKEDITADLLELEKCYQAGCYRSVTIICGRLLETALHRKYYEATGMDILEKNPGIGLGNLIAKLAEKSVKLDPGLTQQIHLINQVRVFSVHKKQQAFYPSKAQAEAMILYTTDALGKLFQK